MSKPHMFVFEPGTWLGEGKVRLSISEEDLKYFTRWQIEPAKEGKVMNLSQEIEIKGVPDKMVHRFKFHPPKDLEFKVELENEHFGKVSGQGLLLPKKIAWEFRGQEGGVEGFEVYELQEDGSYFVHAEYVTKEDFRTLVQGKIWKKSTA